MSIFDIKSQIVVWEFRANRDTYESPQTLMELLKKLAKKWTFQLERGSNTGYEHYQGRMSLWKPKRGPELKALMDGMGMAVPEYCQPTTTKEHKNEAFYVLKEDTRIDGPWTNKDVAQYIPRQYRNIDLYPWQQEVIESKNLFNERIVDCIVDVEGCNGKSTLASIADLRCGCIDMPTVSDGKELIQSMCDILIAQDNRAPGIVFFDMPRAQSKEKLGGLYMAIEQIKKGKVWDFRHSYKEWWFDSPRIWIFCNEPPKMSLLSRDRWRFHKIVDGRLEAHFPEGF